MSYCRWSSDDFSCDIYCYADVAGGFTIHVAGNRVLGDIPKLPAFPTNTNDQAALDAYVTAHRGQLDFIRTADREAITLPHAAETFNEPTATLCIARLLKLREIGYRVPQYAIDALAEEIASGDET